MNREVAGAGDAWRDPLVERGILPFLRGALADPGTAGTLPRTAPPMPAGRVPASGYDRAGSAGPDNSPAAGHRPGFANPDCTGPDHRPEQPRTGTGPPQGPAGSDPWGGTPAGRTCRGTGTRWMTGPRVAPSRRPVPVA
ncbi:hypothetical protein SUDANB6_02984 [Streptomyces sp. enrichment culture]